MPKFSLYICIKYLRRFLRDMLYSKAICCLSVVILNHTWLSQLLFISFTISHNSFWIFFPPIIFISWRLITLQYCSGFCHTLTWISHGFTCVPHPVTPLPRPSPSLLNMLSYIYNLGYTKFLKLQCLTCYLRHTWLLSIWTVASKNLDVL